MGRTDGAALVFLTASTLPGEEIRPSAFDTGALDGLVDIEHNLIFGGEFKGLLVVVDAGLGVVELLAAVNIHHGAGIARFDVVDTVGDIVLIGVFDLVFIVINVTDGFVVADDFDVVFSSIFGYFRKIKIWDRVEEVGGGAVGKPVAIPTIIPTFHEQASNT